MANTISAANLFCVVYRRGGSANFTWHRSVAMSKPEAVQTCADTARMGYKAMVVNYAQSLAIGLPDTYEA